MRIWRDQHYQVELLPAAPYSARDPSVCACLGISLQRQRGVHSFASDHRVDFDRMPGTLSLTPPRVEMFSESGAGGEYLAIRYGGTIAEPPAIRQVGTLGGQHGAMWRRALALRAALLATGPLADEAIEQLVGDLILAVTPASINVAGDASFAAEAIDRIDACLPLGGVSLAGIAAEMGLSAVAFLRAFRKATGLRPGDHIRERRVQLARAALERSATTSLAEVAAEAGFAQQSHMGAAFRRSLGITPGAYRAVLS